MSSSAPQGAAANPRRTVTVISAKQTIPFLYRFILVTVEPLAALSGVLMALKWPENLIATLTRESTAFREDHAFAWPMLGGTWFYFAFIELFVLHAFDDRRLWRMLCLGMLLSDIPNLHGTALAVGGWANYLRLQDWTVNDWLVAVSTFPQLIVRVLIVLGIGIGIPKQTVAPAKKDE